MSKLPQKIRAKLEVYNGYLTAQQGFMDEKQERVAEITALTLEQKDQLKDLNEEFAPREKAAKEKIKMLKDQLQPLVLEHKETITAFGYMAMYSVKKPTIKCADVIHFIKNDLEEHPALAKALQSRITTPDPFMTLKVAPKTKG